jgi:3-oxoacyl-[acyl-carrier protein] reductase
MDFGIAGRTAIVCAASRGLGRAAAFALAGEGVRLVINARDAATLEATAEAIRRAHGVTVRAVAGDITTEAGREAVLAACDAPDILINNAGGPPPGDFRNVEREDWLRAVDANMVSPILLIRAVIDGMVARRFGRIVNITATGVKSPASYPQLGVSIGARAGLTGFIGVLARQHVADNVTINGLLPGRFATDRLRQLMDAAAAEKGASPEAETARLLSAIPAGRFGTPEEFGAWCAFLCSAHASYVTGQNIVLDGGSFPGVL